MTINKIRTVELFAGVGGFRLGLEGWNGKSSLTNYTENINSKFKIVWSNQWEPKNKLQIASKVYESKWNDDNHSSVNIQNVSYNEIPEFDMLVGGFPCQDYSVAKSLTFSKGLEGNKGALWWSIYDIIYIVYWISIACNFVVYISNSSSVKYTIIFIYKILFISTL
jgi:DNA (cytosine-5)-methyltransferase 1